MEVNVMKIIEVDFIVVWIFYSFKDVLLVLDFIKCFYVNGLGCLAIITTLSVWDVRMPYSLFFMLFSIWHLSIVIDGRTSPDWSLGPMFMNTCWSPCLCSVCVLWVRSHRVEVIFNVFSFFFCYVIMEKGYHNCFITTVKTQIASQLVCYIAYQYPIGHGSQ